MRVSWSKIFRLLSSESSICTSMVFDWSEWKGPNRTMKVKRPLRRQRIVCLVWLEGEKMSGRSTLKTWISNIIEWMLLFQIHVWDQSHCYCSIKYWRNWWHKLDTFYCRCYEASTNREVKNFWTSQFSKNSNRPPMVGLKSFLRYSTLSTFLRFSALRIHVVEIRFPSFCIVCII